MHFKENSKIEGISDLSFSAVGESYVCMIRKFVDLFNFVCMFVIGSIDC